MQTTQEKYTEKHGPEHETVKISALHPENSVVPNPKPKKRKKMSRKRMRWICLTWLGTWYIPSICLSLCGGMKTPAVRMAWREKVCICILIFFASCSLLFILIGFGPIICPKQAVFTAQELSESNSKTYAYGRVYNIDPIIQNHFSGYSIQSFQFQSLLGADSSSLFNKQNLFTMYCPQLDQPSTQWDNLADRPKTVIYSHKAIDSGTGTQKTYMEFMNQYAIARLVWSLKYIQNAASPQKKLIVINNNVYDVSSYFNSEVKFLGPSVQSLFANYYGKDATPQWNQISRADPRQAAIYMNCINNLFYIGALDYRGSLQCQIQDFVLLSFTGILVFIILAKFLAAFRCTADSCPDDCNRYVIINVPVYSETRDGISATLESIAATKYDDSRKLLFIVCDGVVTGKGNDMATSKFLLDILDINQQERENEATLYAYESLGEVPEEMTNMAQIYSGHYSPFSGTTIPFIAVIKVGNPGEVVKPGNRGKRDSQLILIRFLNRVHFDRDMSPLEIGICEHLDHGLGLHPGYYEYLMMVDADTIVDPGALNHFISTFVHDQKIVGLCGETNILNENDSYITMLQVYEYYISHHLSKAFESMFGSVSCLPGEKYKMHLTIGCFSIYRIRTLSGSPIIISPMVLKQYGRDRVETLHMKNLLLLGEDRFLTTLVLETFPRMKICFNPKAKSSTIVPDQWSVLLSQRRRWINSTVHCLWKLLELKQMCGCFCFSMRFIILMDLFATILQPAGILYLIYLIYVLSTSSMTFPLVSVIMIAGAYGLQVLLFAARKEWSQIGWMIIYLIGMPLSGFCLPIYAWWHFDDFSKIWATNKIPGWGKTRAIDEVDDIDDQPDERKKIVMSKFDSNLSAGNPKKSRIKTESVASRVRNWNIQGATGSHSSTSSVKSNGRFSAGKSVVSSQPPRFPAPCSINSQNTKSLNSKERLVGGFKVPTDVEIIAELKCILNEVQDLSSISKRQIRQLLEKKLKMDFSNRKTFISQQISLITNAI